MIRSSGEDINCLNAKSTTIDRRPSSAKAVRVGSAMSSLFRDPCRGLVSSKKKSRHNVAALRKLTNNKGLPLPPNTTLDDRLIAVACCSGTEVDLNIIVDTA